MEIQGVFGYIIGKKKRLMHVQYHADLLWQILVREIYVLMKHYGSKEKMQEVFEKIKTTKNNPKPSDIKKYQIFTETNYKNYKSEEYNYKTQEKSNEWNNILRFCQGSYINILEAGYILNQKEEYGIVFMLDFNKGIVTLCKKNYEGKIIEEYEAVTIEEIMNFDEMPTKTYTEIVTEMNDKYVLYYDNLSKIDEELKKLETLKQKAKIQNAVNIENKVDDLIYEMLRKRKELISERRVFYNRLRALDLIEDEK
jgi:hypothetical protein